jgi:hypothetical protein
VKTAALRPTCCACRLHLPTRGARIVAAHHPQYSYRPSRNTKWSLLPRALLPQKAEDQSEQQTVEDPAVTTFASLLQECSLSSSQPTTPTAAAAAAAAVAAVTDPSPATAAPSPFPPETAVAVELRPGIHGRGLISTTEIPSSGNIILNVPLNTCLVVDYSEKGLQLPPGGTWPRVQRGLAKDNSLPWDIIHALALLDGLAGDGNEFWTHTRNADVTCVLA